MEAELGQRLKMKLEASKKCQKMIFNVGDQTINI